MLWIDFTSLFLIQLHISYHTTQWLRLIFLEKSTFSWLCFIMFTPHPSFYLLMKIICELQSVFSPMKCQCALNWLVSLSCRFSKEFRKNKTLVHFLPRMHTTHISFQKSNWIKIIIISSIHLLQCFKEYQMVIEEAQLHWLSSSTLLVSNFLLSFIYLLIYFSFHPRRHPNFVSKELTSEMKDNKIIFPTILQKKGLSSPNQHCIPFATIALEIRGWWWWWNTSEN